MADLSPTAHDLVIALCQRRYPASAGPCVKPCDECREDAAFIIRVLTEQEPLWEHSRPNDFYDNAADEFNLTDIAQSLQRHTTRSKLMDIATELDPDF
jgi:hypothetical protein